jgi:hypothetical protein
VFEPVRIEYHHMGEQMLFRFDNGYGASIINNDMSYGIELAVIYWEGEDFHLIYDTPITDDVIGYLDRDRAETLLEAIEKLPPRLTSTPSTGRLDA